MGETQAPVSEVCSVEGKGRPFSGPLSALYPGDFHVTLASTWMAPLPPRSLPESSRLGQVPRSGSYDTQLFSF